MLSLPFMNPIPLIYKEKYLDKKRPIREGWCDFAVAAAL
jgi:hypothetical protein